MLSTIAIIAMTGSLTWTKQTYYLQEKIIKIGWSKENSKNIINECKKIAKDPNKCVVYAAAIGKNETGAGRTVYKHSLFGIQKSFTSDEEAIKYWVKTWNKKWYKAQSAKHFYSPTPGITPKTGYCKSEYQSNGKLLNYCPNGYKNTSHFLSLLK